MRGLRPGTWDITAITGTNGKWTDVVREGTFCSKDYLVRGNKWAETPGTGPFLTKGVDL